MENQITENQNTKDEKVIDHLKFFYPRQEVGLMGSGKYGIHFRNLMFNGDFEKINHIGFDIVCIQANKKGDIIATIKDRRKDR